MGCVCWGFHVSLCGSCGVDMLRLHVQEDVFNFVPCEGPRLRSSPCVPMMLVDEGKHCSQMLSLKCVGPFLTHYFGISFLLWKRGSWLGVGNSHSSHRGWCSKRWCGDLFHINIIGGWRGKGSSCSLSWCGFIIVKLATVLGGRTYPREITVVF